MRPLLGQNIAGPRCASIDFDGMGVRANVFPSLVFRHVTHWRCSPHVPEFHAACCCFSNAREISIYPHLHVDSFRTLFFSRQQPADAEPRRNRCGIALNLLLAFLALRQGVARTSQGCQSLVNLGAGMRRRLCYVSRVADVILREVRANASHNVSSAAMAGVTLGTPGQTL